MKIADIDSFKTLGRCPTPTRNQSLDPFSGLCPHPSSPEGREKGAVAPFPCRKGCSVNLMSRGFRGITGPLPHYSTFLLTTIPLRSHTGLFLEIENSLLSEEDEQLPLTWHVVCTLQYFHLVEDFVAIVLMRAEEVVISNP